MTRSIVEQAHDMYDAVPYEVPVPEKSLYSLLDDAARLYPDRVAIDYFGATTTYSQVRDQVLKAARVLHEAGGALRGHCRHRASQLPAGLCRFLCLHAYRSCCRAAQSASARCGGCGAAGPPWSRGRHRLGKVR